MVSVRGGLVGDGTPEGGVRRLVGRRVYAVGGHGLYIGPVSTALALRAGMRPRQDGGAAPADLPTLGGRLRGPVVVTWGNGKVRGLGSGRGASLSSTEAPQQNETERKYLASACESDAPGGAQGCQSV